jgi:hypothetical protein
MRDDDDEPEFSEPDIYEDFPEEDINPGDLIEDEGDFMDEYLPGDEVLDGDRQIPGVTLNGAPIFETDFNEESK